MRCGSRFDDRKARLSKRLGLQALMSGFDALFNYSIKGPIVEFTGERLV